MAMNTFKINKLQTTELLEDGKLKLIYDCSNEEKIAEIEYIVDLNKTAHIIVSENYDCSWEYEHDVHRIRKNFPTYKPQCNVAFMFDTDKPYVMRVQDRVKKMTVEEIEKKLGYKIEIVSSIN